MVISEANIEVIRSAWKHVLQSELDLPLIFYGKLFDLNPRLRPLFPADIRKQSKTLLSHLTYIIESLHDQEKLRMELGVLGERHIAYGVKRSDFETAGEALLFALECVMLEKWTEAEQKAFGNVVNHLNKAETQPTLRIYLETYCKKDGNSYYVEFCKEIRNKEFVHIVESSGMTYYVATGVRTIRDILN